MNDDFAKMFAAWMEQGQKMASAFMPGMENVDAKAFEKFFPPMPKELTAALKGYSLLSHFFSPVFT